MLNTYTVPCYFIYSVHKRYCYLCVSTLASKHISGSLFVFCLSLNMFFLPFSGILTCTYINHTYPAAVYTLNTRSTPYCSFLTAENVPLTFHAVVWLWKHARYFFSNLETSKYVKTALFVVLLVLNTLFLLLCSILTCNCISRIDLVAV